MSLNQLEHIRSRRLESTYVEVQINRTQIAKCREELQQLERALVQFMIWKKKRQDELFDELNASSFTVSKLDGYNAELKKIESREAEIRAKIPKAREAVEGAEKRYLDSKQKLQSVTKDLEKVKEFISVEDEEGKRAMDAQDEQQSDELASARNR